MTAESKSSPRFWPFILQALSWLFLFPGFLLIGKSAFEIVRIQHVTTNALSWSTAGLLLLLIGSLANSCRKELKPDSSN